MDIKFKLRNRMMTWGRFTGRCFDNMPKEYLLWLLRSQYCKNVWKPEINRVLDKWAQVGLTHRKPGCKAHN